jgi:hypothetical protein
MRVRIRTFGSLSRYLGRNQLEVDLPTDACIKDLYQLIQNNWGTVLPPELWDSTRLHFREQVVVMIDQSDVYDDTQMLSNGVEIWLVEAIAGG